MTADVYDLRFQRDLAAGSKESAERVMPHVLRLVGPVTSAVDIGCGAGPWLRATGATRLVGVDGHWSRDGFEAAGPGEFVAADLSDPVHLDERFDLAISMEVAEHLDEGDADIFVASLVRHADVILFSAAIPGQGGTHHVNEQWPDYWAEKFEAFGYVCMDMLRDLVWNDKHVMWWYRQNVLLFATPERAAEIGPAGTPERRRMR